MNRKHESNELKMDRVEVYRGDKLTSRETERGCVVSFWIDDPVNEGNEVNREFTFDECVELAKFFATAIEGAS